MKKNNTIIIALVLIPVSSLFSRERIVLKSGRGGFIEVYKAAQLAVEITAGDNPIDSSLNNVNKGDCDQVHRITYYDNKGGHLRKNGQSLHLNVNNRTYKEATTETLAPTVPSPIPPSINEEIPFIAPVTALTSEAEALNDQGHYEEALFKLDQANRLQPRHPKILLKLAKTHLFQGNYENAVQLVNKALILRPDSVTKEVLYAIRDQAEIAKMNSNGTDKSDLSIPKPIAFGNITEKKSERMNPENFLASAQTFLQHHQQEEAVLKLEEALTAYPDEYAIYQKLIDIKMAQHFYVDINEIVQKAQNSKMSDLNKLNLKTALIEAQLAAEKAKGQGN